MTVDGKPVSYTGPGKCQQVIKQGIATTMTSMLEGVITGGTGCGQRPDRAAGCR